MDDILNPRYYTDKVNEADPGEKAKGDELN